MFKRKNKITKEMVLKVMTSLNQETLMIVVFLLVSLVDCHI